jgi:glutathione synthase/RimK-type ligase-like ATP-grasp enzyme
VSFILIVTNRSDPHADRLINALGREARVFRWNTEATNTETRLSFGIDEAGTCTGSLVSSPYRDVDLADIRSVWYRKPVFDFEFSVSDANRAFAVSETRSSIDGLLSLMPKALWVNDPWSAGRSRIKSQQLALAGSLGFRVPRTLVTTDVGSALEFVESCNDHAIAKAVYSATALIHDLPQAVPTQLVTMSDLLKWRADVAVCPVQFQEYIVKAYELRITVIGEKVFGIKIDSQLDKRTRIDWRPFCEICPHQLIDLPSEVDRFCRQFIRMQGLTFGAIDMIVTPEGEHVFLENNPFGQYLWLEDMTGAPLTRTIADLLISS